VIRKTSRIAYKQIQEQGLLSQRRFEVYEALFYHGPLTANEAREHIGGHVPLNSVSPRMAELKDRGVVVEVGEKICSVTGKKAILWDVTDSLPVEPPKRETSKEKIAKLEAENTELKKRLAQYEPVAS